MIFLKQFVHNITLQILAVPISKASAISNPVINIISSYYSLYSRFPITLCISCTSPGVFQPSVKL